MCRLSALLLFLLPTLGFAQSDRDLAGYVGPIRRDFSFQITVTDSITKPPALVTVNEGSSTLSVRGRKVIEGALIGLTVGALAGGVLETLGGGGSSVAVGVIVGAVPGALIGAAVAAIVESRRTEVR